ncbi:hypothetical protein COY62_00380 [bacterium (Candidatus Howlettbacteria) CG_4_10_14_0_8_um_filter_40_9]|nr:MAG: hypothetical protein COY62_00380 [bacterium (Candidatus Howlettbacteria) CG_4_10_14_0_8_um_filter_40_9]
MKNLKLKIIESLRENFIIRSRVSGGKNTSGWRLVADNQQGSVLIGSILVLILVLSFALTLTTTVMVNSIYVQRSYQNIAAMSYAEASIEKTMWELNNATTPTCNPSCSFGSDAEVDVDVTNIDSDNKEITATAYAPNKANYKTKKIVKIKISATPDTFGIAFNYAIQAGVGGIDIKGSSEVKGNLYSNGNITVANPAHVKEPGDAWAVGIISDPSDRIDGTKTAGAPSVPLPHIDLQAWKDLASSGGTVAGDYSPPNSGSFTDLGPKEITGNVSMSTSGQKINLFDPLYIHGNLTISGGDWKLDDSMESNGTIVLVDGVISVSGSAKFSKNSNGQYILFVSTNTANTSANPAINFTGSVDVKSAAFYAYNGSMKFSGSGEIIAMTGQTLFIEGNGEIEYKSGLASANFGGGPGGIWRMKSWQQLKN